MKQAARGCLIALGLFLAVSVFLFNRCLEGGEEAFREEPESARSRILEEIPRGADFDLNRNVFADDSSNYEEALGWCEVEFSPAACMAALEDVVGEPVDLAELHAQAEGGRSGRNEDVDGRFRARVGDFFAHDGDTVLAEVRIKNIGSTKARASCFATIDNTTGNSGHDFFTTKVISPGDVFRARYRLETEDGTATETTNIRLVC